MNKEHFLTELKIHLKPLPQQQIAYILQLYTEKFDKRSAEGEHEAEISKDLGSPQVIADEILAEFGVVTDDPIHDNNDTHAEWKELTNNNGSSHFNYSDRYDSQYRQPNKAPSFFMRFCQVTGVILFNFLLMFWMIFAFLAVLFAFWLVVICLIFSPIAGVIAFLGAAGSYALFQLSFSILMFGLGLVGLAIMTPLTLYTFRFLKHYFKWTGNVLRGKRS